MQPWVVHSMEQYHKAYRRALSDPNGFWHDVASTFSWRVPYSTVKDAHLSTGDIAWFTGGELNITENALDRHVASTPDKAALIWEGATPDVKPKILTYRELLQEVCRTAGMLTKLGVAKGDRVTIYMPMVPELLFAVLACARLGAVHSVVFAGFSAEALATRLADTASRVVLTADGVVRGGTKVVPLQATVDEALALLRESPVQHVVTLDRGLCPVKSGPLHRSWTAEIEGCATYCEAVACGSEDPLFVLYTSGSTGSPKGILHTQGGYMVWAAYTFANVFQVDDDSIHWCTADLGWITGHSYLAYGPLLTGTTTVMFEGVPTWPDASRLWQVVERHRVTHFYTAPTLIRALQGQPENLVTEHDRSSLRVLGSVGEPINASAWQWYFDLVGEGRCPVVDTWWQTETGGIMISALAGVSPTRPTYAGLPLPGIVPVLVDDNGVEVGEVCASGNLCIKEPWPGMMRTVHGNFERFLNGYLRPFPGFYFTGDGAMRDVDGMIRVTGRVDDVLNVSGHRLGTAEIENAINRHEAIVESAVVGLSDDLTGQAVCAFVVLSKEAGETLKPGEALPLLQAEVTKHIGALAKPKRVFVVPGLPKTRSGKIMRRILRALSEGRFSHLGDTSTLVNPEIVSELEHMMRAQGVEPAAG